MSGIHESIKTWRLYVITDDQLSRGRSHVEVAREAIGGGADIIQLRDKNAPGYKLYEVAYQLRQLTRKAGIPLIINDRIDIGLAVDADGVHVGQDDIPAAIVRNLIGPDKILGVSAGSLEEAGKACRDGADYLGVGPVFEARGTKSDAVAPLGLRLLKNIRQDLKIPIIAIGGINITNVQDVIDAGADGVAIISAIISAPDINHSARQIKSAILEKGT